MRRLWILLLLCACRFELGRELGPGEIRGTLLYVPGGGSAEPVPAVGAVAHLVGTSRAARADAAGRFVLRRVPSGTWSLHARFAEGGRDHALLLRVDLVDAGRGALGAGRDLGRRVLNAAGTVRGTVTRGGAPVEGAQIVATGFAAVASREDGTYELFLPDGEHELAAVYPDAAGTRVQRAATVVLRASATVDFALGPGDPSLGEISGEARRADTRGGADVRVALVPQGGAGRIDLPETGTDGAWAAAGVAAGVYALVAEAEGYLPAATGPVVAAPGAQAPALVLFPATGPADCDADGTADDGDTDDDEDGVADETEAAPCRCDPGGTADVDGNGVCDRADGAQPDAAPPAVLLVSPADGATDADPAGALQAVFSEPLDPQSVGADALVLTPAVDGALSLSRDRRTLSFAPVEPLLPSAAYAGRAGRGVRDAAGNTLRRERSWEFVTAPAVDAVAPEVVGTAPTDLAEGVAAETSPSVLFSEPVRRATVEAGGIVAEPPIAGRFEHDGALVRLVPDAPLRTATRYEVVVGTDVRDWAGNPLAAAYTFSFATAPAALPDACTDVAGCPTDLPYLCFAERCQRAPGAGDLDGDGVSDAAEAAGTPPADSDHDGLPDHLDPDSDADGVSDRVDNCRVEANTDQGDLDGDGPGDACDRDADGDAVSDLEDNCTGLANPGQENLDLDLLGDACDSDADGDGVTEPGDNCPRDGNPDQADGDTDSLGNACDGDDDGDGVFDEADNCPLLGSADQADSDTDGAGDPCDLDDDGDGVSDEADNCPLLGSADQADSDTDSLGDPCDLDDDGDGFSDDEDNCPRLASTDRTDSDTDGAGDPCDLDDDGDGFSDDEDNCPRLASVDRTDSDTDSLGDPCDPDDDGDGVSDAADNCPRLANADQADGDSDGAGDACDTPSGPRGLCNGFWCLRHPIPTPYEVNDFEGVASDDLYLATGSALVHRTAAGYDLVPYRLDGNDVPWRLSRESAGRLWVLEEWGDVFRYEGSPAPPLDSTSEWANDLWADPATGEAWIACDNGLLRHYDGLAFHSETLAVLDNLEGVHGSSATDVWAVGGRVAFHYDGSTWSEAADVPFDATDTAEYAYDVFTTGGDVVVVSDLGGASAGTAVMHRRGGAWTRRVFPGFHSYWDLHGSGPDDLWVSWGEGLAHWDGTRWTRNGGACSGAGKLVSVHSLGPAEAWLGGFQGQLARWDGVAWVPAGNSQPLNAWWTDAVVFAPDDAWAVEYYGGRALRWDGARWSAADLRTDGYLQALAGDSASDVWAVGGAASGDTGAVVRRFDGAAWREVEPGTDIAGDLVDVAVFPGPRVFALSRRRVHEWSAGAWTTHAQTGAPVANGTTTQLYGVFGSSASDVYVTGSSTTVWHWDGAAWTATALTAGKGRAGVAFPGGAAAFVAMDGYVFTRADAASPWTRTTLPGTVSTSRGLRALWGASPNDLWIGGKAGEVLRWDGAQWRTLPVGASADFFAVAGSSASDVWLVGEAVGRWDGSLLRYPHRTEARTAILAAAWVSPAGDDGWALGRQGTALRWDGTAWRRVPTPFPKTSDYAGIWASGPGNVWAVGGKTAQRFDGDGWTDVPTGAVTTLKAVDGSGPDDLWAVGMSGTRLHWDGAAWSSRTDGVATAASLEDVAVLPGGEAWAVGASGTVLRWTGALWEPVSVPGVGTTTQYAVVAGATPRGTEVWICGNAGVFQYAQGAWTDRSVPLEYCSELYLAPDGSVYGNGYTNGFRRFTTAWETQDLPIAGNATAFAAGPTGLWVFGQAGSVHHGGTGGR